MKIQLLFFSVICASIVFTQNVTFEKKLDDKISLSGDYHNGIHPAILYDKIFDNCILRLEENKVQIFNENFDKISETKIEPVKSVGGQNYHHYAGGNEYLYIVSYGAAFTSGNAESRLTVVSKTGESKSIKLSDQIELRGVTEMKVVNENLYLFYSRTTGAPTPYTSLEIFTASIQFNHELEKQNEIYEFPAYLKDSKQNLTWYIDGIKNEQFVFTSYYYMNEKGKRQFNYKKGLKTYKAEIRIDFTNKGMYNEDIPSSSEEYNEHYGYYTSIKFDTAKYQIETDNMILANYRPRGFMNYFTLKVNNGVPIDIKKQFLTLTDKEKGLTPVIYFTDAIDDPINKNITMFIRTDMSYYVLNFDENHQLAFVYEIETNFAPLSSNWEAFIYGITKLKKTFGTIPTNHKGNAFDLVMKLNKKCQFSVLNYENYQLLFTDSKDNGETMVYKIEP